MKKILVINFRYFGDALISASLSVRIRELWPDAHITYLVFDSVEGVLEGIETIDEILTVPERPDKWEQFRWMAAHWNDYDLAFVTPTGTRPGLYGFFMARERIGFTPGFTKRNWWKKLLLTKHVQEVSGPKILQFDSLLTATGAEPAKAPYVPQPHAQLPAEACFDRPYVVVHPMPRYAYKAWSSNNWSALVRRLNDAGVKVVLTGGNNASELAAIRDIVPEGADAVILAGKLSFGQTAELIARSKGFVGPDTGTTHVASSTGVPIVTLFGPSDPTAWGPWGRGQTKPFDSRNDGVPQRRGNVILLKKHCKCQGGMGCLNRRDSHSDCLNELTVDEVWDALKELEVVA